MKKNGRTPALWLLIFLLLMGLNACATQLEPAPGANQVAGLENAARQTADGVTILVQAAGWPGPVDINEEVTPLRVRITNGSTVPLRIRFNEFKMVGVNSKTFSALPPARIQGEVTGRAYYGDIYNPPGFLYDNFSIAPHFAPLYPGLHPYVGYFPMDTYYYDTYSGYWASYDLPTPEMRVRAIPEGVINQGGVLEGWLYFEKLDGDADEVIFRADLVNAENGKDFAEIRIPFLVR